MGITRFRFKLDPLLRHRIRQERDCKRVLADFVRQRMAIEARIRANQQQIQQTKMDLTGNLTGRVDTLAIRAHAAMSLQLDAQTRRLALTLAEVYRHIETARTELLAATRRRKAIELLRERRYRQWLMALNRSEQNELDDLTTVRFDFVRTLMLEEEDEGADTGPLLILDDTASGGVFAPSSIARKDL